MEQDDASEDLSARIDALESDYESTNDRIRRSAQILDRRGEDAHPRDARRMQRACVDRAAVVQRHCDLIEEHGEAFSDLDPDINAETNDDQSVVEFLAVDLLEQADRFDHYGHPDLGSELRDATPDNVP
jgi:hypothetical protein